LGSLVGCHDWIWTTSEVDVSMLSSGMIEINTYRVRHASGEVAYGSNGVSWYEGSEEV
jgi:hypothetical protein